jgi:hypothetical protein
MTRQGRLGDRSHSRQHRTYSGRGRADAAGVRAADIDAHALKPGRIGVAGPSSGAIPGATAARDNGFHFVST